MMAMETEGAAARILVVDDERDIVDYLIAVLQDNGYDAEGVYDSAAALEELRRRPPDLVLLDVMMPGRTGLSLFQTLKQTPRLASIPVLFISGYSREEEFHQLELEGLEKLDGESAPVFLEKPIRVPVLLKNVKALLQRPGGEA
ncbi:MAG: response regulator [Acidobacteriota bacterium]